MNIYIYIYNLDVVKDFWANFRASTLFCSPIYIYICIYIYIYIYMYNLDVVKGFRASENKNIPN